MQKQLFLHDFHLVNWISHRMKWNGNGMRTEPFRKNKLYKQQKHTHILHVLKRWFVQILFFLLYYICFTCLSERIAMYSPLSWWLYVLRTIASLILIHFLTCLLAFCFFCALLFHRCCCCFFLYLLLSVFVSAKFQLNTHSKCDTV